MAQSGDYDDGVAQQQYRLQQELMDDEGDGDGGSGDDGSEKMVSSRSG